MADVISVSELNHYVKTLLDVNDGLFDLCLLYTSDAADE